MNRCGTGITGTTSVVVRVGVHSMSMGRDDLQERGGGSGRAVGGAYFDRSFIPDEARSLSGLTDTPTCPVSTPACCKNQFPPGPRQTFACRPLLDNRCRRFNIARSDHPRRPEEPAGFSDILRHDVEPPTGGGAIRRFAAIVPCAIEQCDPEPVRTRTGPAMGRSESAGQ